jgi:hypothetical protein
VISLLVDSDLSFEVSFNGFGGISDRMPYFDVGKEPLGCPAFHGSSTHAEHFGYLLAAVACYHWRLRV